VGPIEIFDRGWVLWNLSLIPDLAEQLQDAIQPHVDLIAGAWMPGRGIASAVDLPLLDSDNTAIVYAAFQRLGFVAHDLDVEAIMSYKSAYNFKCYPLESDPSTSANVHVLDALRQADLPDDHIGIRTAHSFLSRTQTLNMFWLDKWHASPYYPTAHAIIALTGLDNDLAKRSVDWLLHTQRQGGSWGWYMPTAEETAYALQALAVWHQHEPVDRDVLARGRDWLRRHMGEPLPPLWIGKSLYTPVMPVKSAILSALRLVERILG
jgi:halimadienyl-diphosphate synthase